MSTVKLNGITIGRFKYDAVVELDAAQEEAIKQQGVLRLLQGKPSGDWEKSQTAILYPNAKKREDIKVPDEENGGMRAFRRTDIPYSDDAATALKKAYSSVEFTIGEDSDGKAIKSTLLLEVTGVEEYEPGSGSAPKFAREKAFIKQYLAANGGKLQDGSARTVAAFAENRGIAAPTEPWEEDQEFLGNVKVWYAELLAKQAGAE